MMIVMKILQTGLLLGLLVASFSSQASLLRIVPSSATVAVGDLLNIEVQLSELDDQEEVAFYDLALLFDPLFFELTLINFNQLLNGGDVSMSIQDSFFAPDSIAETSFLSEADLQLLQHGSHTLFSLTLKALAPIVSSGITLALNPFGLVDFDFLDLNPDLQGSAVGIKSVSQAVSSPTVFNLLMLGLLLLVLRQTQAQPYRTQTPA